MDLFNAVKMQNCEFFIITEQEYADWSSRVEKAQQEKSKLDGVLRGLNDEVLHQVI